LQDAIWEIQQDLVKQVDYFKEIGKHRSETTGREELLDLEMIRELGYCSNRKLFSLSRRKIPGTRPFLSTRLFSKDYLMVVESHVTFRKGMYEVTVAERKSSRIWLPLPLQ
jgi:excinuclease ABC subunit B